jgi:hypothetical protein
VNVSQLRKLGQRRYFHRVEKTRHSETEQENQRPQADYRAFKRTFLSFTIGGFCAAGVLAIVLIITGTGSDVTLNLLWSFLATGWFSYTALSGMHIMGRLPWLTQLCIFLSLAAWAGCLVAVWSGSTDDDWLRVIAVVAILATMIAHSINVVTPSSRGRTVRLIQLSTLVATVLCGSLGCLLLFIDSDSYMKWLVVLGILAMLGTVLCWLLVDRRT